MSSPSLLLFFNVIRVSESTKSSQVNKHDWKFYRNVATTGGQAISHAWTSDGVVCWLVTCRLIYESSVKITYLIMTQCSRAFRQYTCFAHDQLIQPSLDLPNYDSRKFRSCDGLVVLTGYSYSVIYSVAFCRGQKNWPYNNKLVVWRGSTVLIFTACISRKPLSNLHIITRTPEYLYVHWNLQLSLNNMRQFQCLTKF